MRAREELARRLALKRRRKIGAMSDQAFAELELAVNDNPEKFVDDDEEQAFALVGKALARYEDSRHDDDLLDDEQYARQRQHRMAVLQEECTQALAVDPECVDAALLIALASDRSQDELFDLLWTANQSLIQEKGSVVAPATGDAWADVFVRPRLRLQAALARTCINTARFAMARQQCVDLLSKAPLDALGARLTCALAMARLEDEEGFNWLDAREGRHGNAWSHLSRVILMYKLGRIPAARRALRGYDRLCAGGAYMLLQPVYVDTYLPDRPEFQPQSLEECMLCVHEADPIVADIPDFVGWTCDQPGFLASAQDYCIRNGFEWRDWEE